MTQTEHFNLTLRSLFRYTFMMERNYPDLIIEMESKILDDRIASLSDEQILFIENNFSNLYHQYLVDSEVEDVHFSKILSNQINNIN